MRDLMACETMQEQGRQYQESNAALQAKLDNAIDTAFDLEAENARLRKVASIAWNVVETRGMSDVLLSELAGRLADWETWKEGAE